jgi:hypothetical protein
MDAEMEYNAKKLLDSVGATMSTIPALLAEMDDLNPVITPVLDMSLVTSEARRFGIGAGNIAPTVSLGQAGVIADTVQVGRVEATVGAETAGGISFTQINNSPEALSTADIYRQTKSQLAVAKKELEH